MSTPARFCVVAAFSLVLAACATAPKVAPAPLEIQALQSREFESSKSIVFASVLTVFQDLGYVVASADRDTGFISASSPSSGKTGFWEALGGGMSSGQLKATAFIEEVRPGFTNVRLNFVDTKRTSYGNGQSQDSDHAILDPKVYEATFERVGDAVFVRSASR